MERSKTELYLSWSTSKGGSLREYWSSQDRSGKLASFYWKNWRRCCRGRKAAASLL